MNAVTVALPVGRTAVVTVVRFVLLFNIGLVALVMIGVALIAAVAIVGIVVVNDVAVIGIVVVNDVVVNDVAVNDVAVDGIVVVDNDVDVNSRQVENQHRLCRSKFCRRCKNAELTISIAT